MSNLFCKLVFIVLCPCLLVSCGSESGNGQQGQSSIETIQQDQLVKNCQVRFSRNDSVTEISTKAYLMKSKCQLSENVVLVELQKI